MVAEEGEERMAVVDNSVRVKRGTGPIRKIFCLEHLIARGEQQDLSSEEQVASMQIVGSEW